MKENTIVFYTIVDIGIFFFWLHTIGFAPNQLATDVLYNTNCQEEGETGSLKTQYQNA